MPYITKEARERVEAMGPSRPGELTYLLYRECVRYARGQTFESFATYAEVLGCLEATKLELYRRHVAPYENIKLEENGDVL